MISVYTLLAANILIVLYCICRRCLNRGGIEFDHNLLFGVGSLLYWVFPIIVGLTGAFDDYPLMSPWHQQFGYIEPDQLSLYLLSTLGFLAMFYMGAWLGDKKVITISHRPSNSLSFARRTLGIWLLISMPLAALLAFNLRGQFFTGYLDDGASLGKGSFVALGNVVLAMCLIYSIKSKFLHPSLSFRKSLANKYWAYYLVLAILVLSLGGRMYLISSIIMLLALRSRYYGHIRIRSILILFTVMAVFSTAMGAWRNGASFQVSTVGFLLSAEFIYTAFSLVTFLPYNPINAINAPTYLSAGLVNLVPLSVLPNKLDYMLDPTEIFRFASPLGAIHSFVSVDINFGIVGGAFVFFLAGFMLSQLKIRKNSILASVSYIMTVGFMTFEFFRDPFEVAIIKNLLEFSWLTPALLVVSLNLITTVLKFTRQPGIPGLPLGPGADATKEIQPPTV